MLKIERFHVFQLNDSDNFDKIAIMNQIKMTTSQEKWSSVLKATNRCIESTGKNHFKAMPAYNRKITKMLLCFYQYNWLH